MAATMDSMMSLDPQQDRRRSRLFEAAMTAVSGKHLQFRPFTNESYMKLIMREAEDKRKQEEKARRANDAFIKDGELKFGMNEEDDLLEKRMNINPDLKEGTPLKEEYGQPPYHLLGIPLEEIDPAIRCKTFVVISRWGRKMRYISRFSAVPSFYCLPVWSPIRRLAVCICTNQFFDLFILTTILTNCISLAMVERDSSYMDIAEFVFFGIYFLEMVIKMTARGVIMAKFTYLRDPWNWLDLLVILSAIGSMIWNATRTYISNEDAVSNSPSQALRIFRVLRVFKTVSIFPGLRTIVNAMLRAFKMLFEVTLLTIFSMMVFSVFSMEVYQGTLRQKCVKDPATLPRPKNIHYVYFYRTVLIDPKYWEIDADGDYKLCGNATGAGTCSHGYICQPSVGENPNFGYTNFDHFGWAMLMSFQLMTLDFWENCYFKILATNGKWSVFFFILTVFFGSFYLLNLMLAVVAITYQEEAVRTNKELESAQQKKKVGTLYDVTLLSANRAMPHRKKNKQPHEDTAQAPEYKMDKVHKMRRTISSWMSEKSRRDDLPASHYFSKFSSDRRSPYQVQRNVLMAVRKWRAYTMTRRAARRKRKSPMLFGNFRRMSSYDFHLLRPSMGHLSAATLSAKTSTSISPKDVEDMTFVPTSSRHREQKGLTRASQGGKPGKPVHDPGDRNVNASGGVEKEGSTAMKIPSIVVVGTHVVTRPVQNAERSTLGGSRTLLVPQAVYPACSLSVGK